MKIRKCVYSNTVTEFVGLDEYCLFERFGPQCDTNEVILMTEARYGRMNIGKCVTSDRGLLQVFQI